MTCRLCGASLRRVVTGLPFKLSEQTIVVVKGLPVLQCENCTEYSLEDPVMVAVDKILEKVDVAAELEIVTYAA